jgi:NADH-quinone oxidoreductase subunit I
MGKFLRSIFLVDLFQGLWVTFRNQNPKYIYTEQYPAERPKVAERYRGAPRLNINPDNGETLCIACNLCALACPVDALELTQDFELASYTREGWIWDRQTLEEGPTPTEYKC